MPGRADLSLRVLDLLQSPCLHYPVLGGGEPKRLTRSTDLTVKTIGSPK